MHTDIVLLVVPAITIILGGLVSAHGPQDPKHKGIWMAIFLAVGALSFACAYVQSKDAEATRTALDRTLLQLSNATASIAREQTRNSRLQEELIAQSTEIVRLSQLGINTAIGGDSFCYMTLGYGDYDHGQVTPVFPNAGKYPLYEVTARITDAEKFRKLGLVKGQRVSIERLLSPMTTLNLGNIAPRAEWANIEYYLSFDSTRPVEFNITFSARNGFWSETLKLVRLGDGQWAQGYWVWRMIGDKRRILLEHRDPGFPKDVGWND